MIGEEGPAESDLDSPSLEEIAQSNQGDMDAGEAFASPLRRASRRDQQ